MNYTTCDNKKPTILSVENIKDAIKILEKAENLIDPIVKIEFNGDKFKKFFDALPVSKSLVSFYLGFPVILRRSLKYGYVRYFYKSGSIQSVKYN